MLLSLIASVVVFLSPRGGCEAAVVKEISKAKTSVWIEAYSFTSVPIITATIAAKARGVDIRVTLDKSWPTESPLAEAKLLAAGVPVLIDSQHAIAHAKVIIIDAREFFAGSFNFTAQAEHSNHEVLLLVNDKKPLAAIIADFNVHAAHSAPPVAPTPAALKAPKGAE